MGHEVEQRLFLILLQLSVIILVARLFAIFFRRLKQPMAVGELAAGLVLGPSLMGWMFPQVFALIFPPDSVSIGRDVGQVLRVISQIGLVFLLFLIGLEFDFRHLRTNIRAAMGISISGIVLPLGLGIGLGHWLYPHVGETVHLQGFTLFLGTAMSITALPMLARMMKELGITPTRLGTIAITAAAVDDVAGWILLASVTAMVRANFEPIQSVIMIVKTVGFALVMIFAVRPLLRRWLNRRLERDGGALNMNLFAILLVLLFLSAMVTSLIGIFAIFGAFLFGAILSGEGKLRESISGNLYNFVAVFFLPVFFTYTGIRTNIGLLHGPNLWLFAAAVSLVAIAGKFGGCSLAAAWSGFKRNESLCIGAMMNTRALMELIVINVGYELGVIPQSVFSMLVMMALLTTIMTTPMLLAFRKGTELEPHLQKWVSQ